MAEERSLGRDRAGPPGCGRGPSGPGLAAVCALLAATAAGCGESAGESGVAVDDGDAGSATVERTSLPAGSTAGPEGAGDRGPAGRPEREAPTDSALRAMAEALVPAVESLAALPFRRPPRLAWSSRSSLEDFLLDELADQWPEERARAVRDAYARLGLVPHELDLRDLLRDLYLEQVVGYYDPEADTLFVRDDVGRSMLRSVLVHELVHALQDQHLDLDSLTEARSGDNDAATAARAALEGHATYAMTAWQFRQQTGRTVDLTRLPNLSELVGTSELASLAGTPHLSGAPTVVRETLIFPYVGGMGLVQSLWRARPERPAPMGRWMPASTEQVLHPDRLLSDPPDAPTTVRFTSSPAGWREVHADGLGELEVRIWLRTHLADSTRADGAAAGWDGDRYRLLRASDGGEALAWVTVWDGPAEADAFRGAAEAAFARFRDDDGDRDPRIRRREVDGRPVVTIWDGPAGASGTTVERALRFRPEGGR